MRRDEVVSARDSPVQEARTFVYLHQHRHRAGSILQVSVSESVAASSSITGHKI